MTFVINKSEYKYLHIRIALARYIFPKIMDEYFARNIGIRQGHTYHRDIPCGCYGAFGKRWPSLIQSNTFATG